MRVSSKLAALLFTSSFLVLANGAAQALTLTFGGGPVTSPPFPGYGTNVGQNNVIKSPLSGNSVNDPSPSPGGGTFVGTVGSNHAVATVGVTPGSGYKVDWYYIGAESGYDVTLNVPGIAAFTEHNQNNQCSVASCGGLASGAAGQIGPQHLGTSTNAAGDPVLDFSLNAKSGAVDKGTLANGNSNPAPGQHPPPGQTNASLVFSYLKLIGNSTDPTTTNEVITNGTVATESTKTWKLRNSSILDSQGGLWFLFAFNDTGGPDDNHDDFVGVGRIYEFLLPPPPGGGTVPVPGAFLLMGTALAGAGGLAKWRRRRRRAAGSQA